MAASLELVALAALVIAFLVGFASGVAWLWLWMR